MVPAARAGGLRPEWVAYVGVDADGPAWIGTCTSKALVGDIHSEDLPLIGPVVPCGSSIRIGGIVCRSETRGLTCTNRDGDGFFLSRQRAEPF